MTIKQTFWGMLITVMTLSTMPTSVWADSSFGGGSGTERDPYIISTTDHMRQLSNDVNGGNAYSGKHFKLANDLDFEGQEYNIIGGTIYDQGAVRSFCGTFDGNGKTISNVTNLKNFSGNGNYAGLFASVNAGGTVKNLTLGGNSKIAGKSMVGGIIGLLHWSGSVVNCHTEESVTIIPNAGALSMFGGIVGVNVEGSISNCTNRATVTKGDTGASGIGGIVGNNNKGTINGCWNYGQILGTHYIGAIVGEFIKGTVTNCYISGGCTINGIGAPESSVGVDTHDTKHVYFIRFANPNFTGGTFITQPIVTLDGTDYYESDKPVEFSELHTFGGVATGKMWTFDAVARGHDNIRLRQKEDGSWFFTMPRWDVAIAAEIATDITYNPNNINITIQESARYDGEPKVPKITLWDAKAGKYLKEGTDFMTDRNPEGYTNVGEHPITLWGIGNYGGEYTGTFTITNAWDGEGTQASPFLIGSTDDMDMLAKLVNDKRFKTTNVYFKQTADLDYAGKTYTAIGTSEIGGNGFDGHFDGSYHSINNVTCTNDKNVGLFGLVNGNANIQSITIGGRSSFTGGEYSGAIAAQNHGNISMCNIPEGHDVTVSGNYMVGSIAGYNDGEINAESYGTVKHYSDGRFKGVAGGIVGCNEGTVYGSFHGSIESEGFVGGIVGQNFGQIFGSINTGKIMAQGANSIVGGIVGENIGNGSIDHCVSNALMETVNGMANAGAIVGKSGNENITNNYYIGACRYGGINGTDVKGKAMRGWPISVDEHIGMHPDYQSAFVGTYFEDEKGHFYYVGKDETLVMTLAAAEFEYEGFTANGNPIPLTGQNEWGDNLYSLTMPAEHVYIKGVGPTFVLLDNDRYDYSNIYRIESSKGKTYDVRIKDRTLEKNNKWSTICLPFSLSAEAIATSPLAGATIMELDPSPEDNNKKTGIEGNTLYLTFKTATQIEEGKPYVIKWSDDGDAITDVRFKEMLIGSETPQTITAASEGMEEVKFIGNYSTKVLYPYHYNQFYMNEQGQIVTNGDEEKPVNAFRGYFEIEESITIDEVKVDFSDATAIDIMRNPSSLTTQSSSEGAVYDLQGRKIADDVSSFMKHPSYRKGIYVVGGKKMVLK